MFYLIETMNTTTATHLLPPLDPAHLPVAENPNCASFTHKSLLNVLNTKCTHSLPNLKQAHAAILRFDKFLYALNVLDQLPKPNVFVYNYLIKGCLDNSEAYRAVGLYCRMVAEDSRPNRFTYPAVFKACAAAGCVEEGRQVHGHVLKLGLQGEGHIKSAGIQMYSRPGKMAEARMMLEEDVGKADVVFKLMRDRSVGSWNVMITGYARCGQIEYARACFDKMSVKDEISWSAMIDGCIKVGCFREALGVFSQMQCEGVELGKHVLSSVLAACANLGALDQGRWVHTYAKRKNIKLESVLGTAVVDMYAKWLVNEGLQIFGSMKDEHGVEPEVEHYGCVVDLLGRAGLLARAEDVIESMPMEPNAAVWGALLGASRIHGNLELGERIGKLLLELEPENSGHIRYYQIFMQRREDGMMLPERKSTRCWKEWWRGYSPNTSEVLFDIEEEEKETTDDRTTIRITKNLRVCGDCHTAMKLVSRVYDRELIVRDRVRYHHFANGSCSCKDYW
uniref:DYW domain-containing protein n=1 Tax=Kalanchoe fedtschenkoi TaxID=63787 RepID=A0A7N0RJI0_KALFE